MKKEKYISRVDSEKSKMFGYLVRLYRGSGVLWQQWFPDYKYGGEKGAFEAALNTRNTKIVELQYNPKQTRREHRFWRPVLDRQPPRSNTGHRGVTEGEYIKRDDKGEIIYVYHYFSVNFVEGKGKTRIRRFYVNKKWNRDEALQAAVKFRNEKELSAMASAIEYNNRMQKERIEAENKIAKTGKRGRGRPPKK
jgi:hypothetical protein